MDGSVLGVATGSSGLTHTLVLVVQRWGVLGVYLLISWTGHQVSECMYCTQYTWAAGQFAYNDNGRSAHNT